MTCNGLLAEGLRPQSGADGSFSFHSERFGEGFHGAIGALREAELKFVQPAGLERLKRGSLMRVVDVGFGLGTNTAALLEAAQRRGLRLEVWGLELDRQPLEQALGATAFRRQWRPGTLQLLEGLLDRGEATATNGGAHLSRATLLWGDARQTVVRLLEQEQLGGRTDLVLLDAFSPQRCPELWSLDFLARLRELLHPQGRLLTYCCAAAVRHSLQRLGLNLASISGPPPAWSHGTAASTAPLEPAVLPLRALNAMEQEHLQTRAAEPYRDPSGQEAAAAILRARQQAQLNSRAESTSAWRRRWGLEDGTGQAA